MRATALSLILALVAATSHLGWPCACEDVSAPEQAMAADHSCCPGATAETAPAQSDGQRIEGVCSPGCCDAPAVITSLAAERAFAWDASPPELALARSAGFVGAPIAPAHTPDGALAPRGPPDRLAVRLALLQTWRC